MPTISAMGVGSVLVAPAAPEGGVGATALDQLVVAAGLGDLAVLDDDHALGVVRGHQPVGDRDHRAALEHRCQRLLEVTCGAGVEQGRGLVEHERVRGRRARAARAPAAAPGQA